MGDTTALLKKEIEHLKRELIYKYKIIEDLFSAIRLYNTTNESQVKLNQIPNSIIDSPNKLDVI